MQPIDMALEAGLLMIRNGGSTVAADRTFSNILHGTSQQGASAIWRLDHVVANHPAVGGGTTTTMRPVGPIGVNLVRASEISALGEKAARGELAGPAIEAEIERIGRLPSPYDRWLTVAMAAATSACFSQISGGDWASFAIAAAAAGVGQTVRSVLQARKAPAAPTTLICGVISALIAALGLRLGY